MTTPQFVIVHEGRTEQYKVRLEGGPDGMSVRLKHRTFKIRPEVRVKQDPPENSELISKAERAQVLGLEVGVAFTPVYNEREGEMTPEKFLEVALEVKEELLKGRLPQPPEGTEWEEKTIEYWYYPVLVGLGTEGRRFEAHFCESGGESGLDPTFMKMRVEGLAGLDATLRQELELLAKVSALTWERAVARQAAEKAEAERKERAELATAFGIPNPDDK